MKMGPASSEAVPQLAKALEDDEPMVRMNAALVLSRLRDKSSPAVPALIQAVRQGRNQELIPQFSCSIQDIAIQALSRAGAAREEIVVVLREILETTTTERTCLAAMRALAEVGTEARPAAPSVREKLKHDNAIVRKAAEEALRKIDG